MGGRWWRRWPRLFILALVYFYCVILLHSRRQRGEPTQVVEKEDAVMLEELKSRGSHIQGACRTHPPPLTKNLKKWQQALPVSLAMAKHFLNLHLKEAGKRLIHIPENRITWCLVPKVASTSFSRSVLHLLGMNDHKLSLRHEPLQVTLKDVIKPIYPERLNTTIQNSKSFLFTRHPFTRIVSAYRNKLEDSEIGEDGQYFYNNYGRRIVERFRDQTKQVKPNRYNGVEDDNGGNTNNVDNPKEIENEFLREPTFSEFIDYIVATDVNDFDEHWRPVWLQCNICDIQFDYVIKYENFQKEIQTLIHHLQTEENLPLGFSVKQENIGSTDDQVTMNYLKKISKEKIIQVYEKYQEDFLYFQYDFDKYLQ